MAESDLICALLSPSSSSSDDESSPKLIDLANKCELRADALFENLRCMADDGNLSKNSDAASRNVTLTSFQSYSSFIASYTGCPSGPITTVLASPISSCTLWTYHFFMCELSLSIRYKIASLATAISSGLQMVEKSSPTPFFLPFSFLLLAFRMSFGSAILWF